jgi:chitinase
MVQILTKRARARSRAFFSEECIAVECQWKKGTGEIQLDAVFDFAKRHRYIHRAGKPGSGYQGRSSKDRDMNVHSPRFRLIMARLSASLGLVIALAGSVHGQNRVVGYYPSWMRYTLPAQSMMFQYLTHVNQAFAWPLADGSITSYSDLLYPQLVTAAHTAGCKVLITLGGWGQSDGFGPMSADSAARSRFIRDLLQYMETNGFDGADIDWESPKDSIDRGNLLTLVRELRTAFDTINTPLLLTMAIPAGSWGGKNFDYAGMMPYLDWYNVMTYDTHGSWSAHAGHNCPLYAPRFDSDGSVGQSVTYLNGVRAIPKGKLVIGIPFYGKEFVADSLYTASSGCSDVLYSSIPARIAAGWRPYWDDLSKAPYLIGPQRTLCYDDSLSATLKCQYTIANGLGGVMMWALGQDIVSGSQVLLSAIGEAMSAPNDVVEHHAPILPGNALLEIFPNPFNPTTVIKYQIPSIGSQGSGADRTRLVVYDLLGREVSVLVDGEVTPGVHEVEFEGRSLASGTYICRLATGLSIVTGKLLLVR